MMKKVSMFIEEILAYIYYSIYICTAQSSPHVPAGILALILMYVVLIITALVDINDSLGMWIAFVIFVCALFGIGKYYSKREEKILAKMKVRQKKVKHKIIIGLCVISIIGIFISLILILTYI